MNKNNKGFSLIEVIVVITILVVLAGSASIGFSIVSGKDATQCASQLKSNILTNRTNALGRTSAVMTVSKDASGVLVTETINGGASASRYVGKKDVNISYSVDGITYNSLDGSSVNFTFDRGSGALSTVNGAPATGSLYFKISKASKEYKVTIHHLTGKTDIE